ATVVLGPLFPPRVPCARTNETLVLWQVPTAERGMWGLFRTSLWCGWTFGEGIRGTWRLRGFSLTLWHEIPSWIALRLHVLHTPTAPTHRTLRFAEQRSCGERVAHGPQTVGQTRVAPTRIATPGRNPGGRGAQPAAAWT